MVYGSARKDATKVLLFFLTEFLIKQEVVFARVYGIIMNNDFVDCNSATKQGAFAKGDFVMLQFSCVVRNADDVALCIRRFREEMPKKYKGLLISIFTVKSDQKKNPQPCPKVWQGLSFCRHRGQHDHGRDS